MRVSEDEKNEIIRTTQQTFKSNADADARFLIYTLEQLSQVDEMLGNRDVEAGFRIRIRNRINELEEEMHESNRKSEKIEDKVEQRAYEKGTRIWSLVTAFVVGIIVTLVGQWLWKIITNGT